MSNMQRLEGNNLACYICRGCGY